MKMRGFTLVEMSVVLVIIALIAGGMMAADSIIESGKKNKVISEIQSYHSATLSFRNKYQHLPGDFPFATKPPGSITPAVTQPFYDINDNTGSGDGNRRIEWSATDNEGIMAFQHMGMAGMIGGTYFGSVSGTKHKHMSLALPGKNLPNSAFRDDVGIALIYTSNAAYSGNILMFGAGNSSGVSDSPAFSPFFVSQIEDKIDDGMPSTGKLLGLNLFGTINANCLNDVVPVGASSLDTYKKATRNKSDCIILYKID